MHVYAKFQVVPVTGSCFFLKPKKFKTVFVNSDFAARQSVTARCCACSVLFCFSSIKVFSSQAEVLIVLQ